jgi:hypothetical protein
VHDNLHIVEVTFNQAKSNWAWSGMPALDWEIFKLFHNVD